MSELPAGVDPDLFEDFHFGVAGVELSHVLERPAELWEMMRLLRNERPMVRGEIYRRGGLGESYRAGGIARTIVKKLDEIRKREGEAVSGFRRLLSRISGVPKDADTVEMALALVLLSAKGREAAAKWVASPDASLEEASTKVKAVLKMVEGYQSALRKWYPVPPPPSSPLDKENRPQMQPRFQEYKEPRAGSIIPTGPAAAGDAAVAVAPAPPPASSPAPAKAGKPESPLPPAHMEAGPAKEPAEAPSQVTLILPRGVDPEILEDIRRVNQVRDIFRTTHQEIEVWEVFCLVMLDSIATRETLKWLDHLRKQGDTGGFNEGALQLFDRLLKLRAQYAKFVRDLRGFFATLPVGTFGKDTMEMALGFVVASSRGRDRAKLWIKEPDRYRVEAAGRLEDIISRSMNYQTALRMTDGGEK